MKFLHSLTRLLVRIETAFLVLFLSVMVLVAFAQVMLRNLFNVSFLWGDPLVRHLVLWVGFLGAAVAAHEGRHISIDALTKYLPARVVSWVKVVTSLFAAVVCWFLAQAAYVYLVQEAEFSVMTSLPIPLPIVLAIMPAGYALLVLHFALAAFTHALEAAQGSRAKEA